jgi:hypothetical protein
VEEMNVVVSVLKWLLPYILKAADKYLPELLDALIQRIKNNRFGNDSKTIIETINKKKEVDNMSATITVSVLNASRVGISGANISYNIPDVAVMQVKQTDTSGNATISGLPAGQYAFKVTANGYNEQTANVTLSDNANSSMSVIMTETEEKKEVENVVINTAIQNAGTSVVDAINKTLTTTSVDNIADAKTAFKGYMSDLSGQMDSIKKSMANEAIDSVTADSATFIQSVKHQLTDSIAWYVTQRGKLIPDNGRVAAKNWIEYLEYTSMIGAMYVMRGTVATFVDTVLKWIVQKVG